MLSESADDLADAHGWGRGWVGLALLASVTSMPELASGVSAVTWVDAPNLAVGNALGAWRRFGLSAAVVLAAGIWLPTVADQLAGVLGLSRSFVGTVFMAIVTTLPEMAVTFGALRLGALDMAIGNLLGGNLFNVTILAVDDAFYRRGSLLADAAPVHAGTAVAAVVMTGLVMIGLVLRPQGRVLRVGSWISIALAAVYLMNAVLVALAAA